jgi:hypothetical protein
VAFTLWARGELIGRTEREFPATPAGARGGVLHPAPAFADVRPIFAAHHEVARRAQAALLALPRPATAEAIRARLAAPDLDPAIDRAARAVAALALEVRDADGGVVAAAADFLIAVAPMAVPAPPGGWAELPAAVRAAAAADLAATGLSLDGPNYLVTVAPRPPGRGAARTA